MAQLPEAVNRKDIVCYANLEISGFDGLSEISAYLFFNPETHFQRSANRLFDPYLVLIAGEPNSND